MGQPSVAFDKIRIPGSEKEGRPERVDGQTMLKIAAEKC
jgi:hypothetical protein